MTPSIGTVGGGKIASGRIDEIQKFSCARMVADCNPTEFQRSPEEFVVGAMLEPESNVSLPCLLAAFSTLRKTGRPVRLVIFGAHDQQELTSSSANQELGADALWL